MSLHTDQSGQPSRLFGKRFPYPLDGKSVILEIAETFAREFNQAARINVPKERRGAWGELDVTGAYPTTRQQCPRITVVRNSSTPRQVGLGMEVETYKDPNSSLKYRVFKGQLVTDSIQVDISTLNEIMRDDLFLWFQQYALDATTWLLPRMVGVFNIACTNASDDQVAYEGTNGQPGFEFYVARLTYQVGYELLVMENVDTLKELINWQAVAYANLPEITNTITFGASASE